MAALARDRYLLFEQHVESDQQSVDLCLQEAYIRDIQLRTQNIFGMLVCVRRTIYELVCLVKRNILESYTRTFRRRHLSQPVDRRGMTS